MGKGFFPNKTNIFAKELHFSPKCGKIFITFMKGARNGQRKRLFD